MFPHAKYASVSYYTSLTFCSRQKFTLPGTKVSPHVVRRRCRRCRRRCRCRCRRCRRCRCRRAEKYLKV